MRELKFRAWDSVSGEWVETVNIRGEGRKEFSIYSFPITPSEIRKNLIIEQYTGLKDKNGRGIYEGDIVEYDWYIVGEKPAYRVQSVVYFDDLGAVLKHDRDTSFVRNCTRVEVIGNIHENEELLK